MFSFSNIETSCSMSCSVGFFLTEPRAAAGVLPIPNSCDSDKEERSTKSLDSIPAKPCRAPKTSSKSALTASLIKPTRDLLITAVGPPD